jgi:molybdopterin molybdotransferase
MDGYAVRSEDLATVPAKLRVIEQVQAGNFPTLPVNAGEATRVTTGAPVPDGADTVIRFEDTDNGTESVDIRDARDLHMNVRPIGEDFHQGDILLHAGTEVTPAALGVLAAGGAHRVKVYRRPTVAVVSSGNQLVMTDRFDAVERSERIVSSNSYTLPALVRGAGGSPFDFGIAQDSEESLEQKIDAARGCDLIITSAGISVGEHEHTRRVMESLGVDLKFWKVRIRPGAPLAFGLLDGTPWISLSGNPVSAIVTFELFVRPAIRKMRGYTTLFPSSFRVRTSEPITTKAPVTHFLRAVVTAGDDIPNARLVRTQNAAVLSTLIEANALLVIPHDQHHIPAGEILQAIPLTGEILRSSRFPV